MSNVSGKAYALTCFCPIINSHDGETSCADMVRFKLQDWGLDEDSPMAQVPNTYLSRFYVLDDVYSQSLAGTDFYDRWYAFWSIFSDDVRRKALPHEDHLKSKYLVFSVNLHGKPDDWLRGFWTAQESVIRDIWRHCYGFEYVNNDVSFIDYIRKCERAAQLFFVGSNDLPLQQQLRSLYLKQEFGRLVLETQGLPAPQLQQKWIEFRQRVDLRNPQGPAWRPGQASLD